MNLIPLVASFSKTVKDLRSKLLKHLKENWLRTDNMKITIFLEYGGEGEFV